MDRNDNFHTQQFSPVESPYGLNPQDTAAFGTQDRGAHGAGTPNAQAPAKRGRQVGMGAVVAISVVASIISGGASGALVAGLHRPQAEPMSSLNMPTVSSASSSNGPTTAVEEVAKAVVPKVVSISVTSPRFSASGSGSIISADGLILTNNHVVAAAADRREGATLTVTLNDSSRTTLHADFIASDPATDIAVIQARGASGLPVMQFANSDQLQVGQPVVAVGSPLGLSATVTTGIVSALNRPVRASDGGGESSLIDAVQTDAAINPGNSGGPLVDMQGNLVGMNSVIASLSHSGDTAGSIGLGFAIPSNFAKRVADQLATTGRAEQPKLGIQVLPTNGERGAMVAAVEPGSPAAEAGLRRGDTIVRLNNRLIDTPDSLIAAVRSHQFGESVTLEVVPDGQEAAKSVTVRLSGQS